MCCTGRCAPSQCETIAGPSFSSLNKPDQERTPAYRDSSGSESPSGCLLCYFFRRLGGAIWGIPVNYVASDTLQTLRDKINVETTNTGVTAKIVADGAGFRLDLDSSSTFTLTDTNGLLDNLNVDNKLVVERESNTVADLFTGVTLTLFAAEAGTTVKLDVDRDLTAVKTDITSFVDAYNATRQIINGHNLTNPTTGLKSDDAGALFGSRTLADIQLSLSSIVGSGVGGVDTSFAALAQIGIDFVNNNTIGDPLLKDTLAIDGTTLDAALLSNPENIRRLFGFDFSSSNSNVVLVNFTGPRASRRPATA